MDAGDGCVCDGARVAAERRSREVMDAGDVPLPRGGGGRKSDDHR